VSAFTIRRTGGPALKVTTLAPRRKGLEVGEFTLATDGDREFTVTSDMEGPVLFRVTAAPGSPESAGPGGYTIQALGLKR
jgi:hypothetical protein